MIYGVRQIWGGERGDVVVSMRRRPGGFVQVGVVTTDRREPLLPIVGRRAVQLRSRDGKHLSRERPRS